MRRTNYLVLSVQKLLILLVFRRTDDWLVTNAVDNTKGAKLSLMETMLSAQIELSFLKDEDFLISLERISGNESKNK